jgi:hypothetical protein
LTKFRLIIFLGLVPFFIWYGRNAWAQTRCPPGATPGSVQCQPDQGSTGAGTKIIREVGRWDKTWGAIADGNNGIGGVTTGKMSENDAKKMALTACVERGGVDCKVSLTYRNQCVAIAQPSVVSNNSKGAQQSAQTIQEASSLALETCRSNNKVSCNVVYEDCSEPIYYEK